MENKNNKNKKMKIWGTAVGASLLLLGTLVGSGFGFANAVKNKGELDNAYNQRVLIETNVNLEGDTTISQVGDYVDDTLQFLGVNNATVYTTGESGDEKIIIDAPISTYINSFDKEKDNSLAETMNSSENNTNFVKAVGELFIATLFNNNLDFRTTTGDQIFTKTGNDFEFNSEVFNTEETETESFRSTSNYGDYDFYSNADVSYSNGVPVINVGISSFNGTDKYLNLFKDFFNFLESNPDTEYVVWFGYDQLQEFVGNLTGESNPDLYATYGTSNWIKPFLVTKTKNNIMNSRFDNDITISSSSNFSEKQASFYARKINNSNSFTADASSINVSLYMNQKSKVALYVMAVLLLIVLILISILMIWYLGLLGLIASASFILVNLFAALIYSTAGLTVTMLGLVGLLILMFISAWMIFLTINRYRLNNDDKYLSPFKRYLEKLKEFNKEMFTSVVTVSILAFVCGIFLPAIISAILFVVVIGNVIAFGLCIFNQLIIFAIDSIIGFTKEYYDVKWSLIIGRIDPLWKKDIKYNDSISKARTTVISLSSIVVLLVAALFGGISYATTGSAINSSLFTTENFYYNVQLVDPTDFGSFSAMDAEESGINELSMVDTAYELTNTYKDDVKEVFKSESKVTSISTVRNDSLTFRGKADLSEGDSEFKEVFEDEMSFGFNITTSDKLSNKQIEAINGGLSKIIPEANSEIEYSEKLGTGFEINSDKLSLTDNKATRLINVTANNQAINGIWMLLIAILAFSLVAIFIGRWGGALTILITSSIEAIFIYAPLFLFVIPFVQIILFPVALLFCLSSGIKAYILKKVKDSERRTEDVWIKNTEKLQFLILLVSLLFAITSLLFIPVVGVVNAIVFGLYSLWIGFTALIVQRYVFTYFARILTNFNDKVRDNKVNDDIRRSKNSNEPQEEYIEGVNM